MAIRHGNNDNRIIHSYTAKEIMEDDYPELWNRATEITNKLVEVQNKLVKMLPVCKENLPKSFEDLAEQKAQLNLSDYIRLRLLYDFTGKLWEFINNQCHELAKKHSEHGEGEKDSEIALCHTLDVAISFPFEEIANDRVTGLLRFNERFIQGMLVIAYGNWEFHDIIGTINNFGLQHERLWRDAVADTIPTCSNIGKLLSDNEMLRVY